MRVVSAPAIKPDVTLTLSATEASKLRRVCYYNKTVARKFKSNPAGGAAKSEDIDAFMANLGSSLKHNGVNRY